MHLRIENSLCNQKTHILKKGIFIVFSFQIVKIDITNSNAKIQQELNRKTCELKNLPEREVAETERAKMRIRAEETQNPWFKGIVMVIVTQQHRRIRTKVDPSAEDFYSLS